MHLRQPFGRISLIVAWIAVVGQLVTAGAFLFVHAAIRDLFPEPVSEEALRDANAGEVEATSKRSKIKIDTLIGRLALDRIGFVDRGVARADICRQDSEGNFGGDYLKVCERQHVYFYVTRSDKAAAEEALRAHLSSRWGLGESKPGSCTRLAGRERPTLTDDLQPGLLVLIRDLAVTDPGPECVGSMQLRDADLRKRRDQAVTPGLVVRHHSTVDEDRIVREAAVEGFRAMVVLRFHETYFSEALT